jgi:hypothetical protein
MTATTVVQLRLDRLGNTEVMIDIQETLHDGKTAWEAAPRGIRLCLGRPR